MKNAPINLPLQIVHEQAEDDGLWFDAQTAPEAYLQQELRRLHAAVENAAVRADRAGREEAYRDKFFMPTEGGEGYLVCMEAAAPSPAEPAEEIHSCSYYCERPECIKRQRDEVVKLMAAPVQQEPDRQFLALEQFRTLLQEGVDGFGRVLVATSDNKAVAEWRKRCEEALQAYPDTHPSADLRAELAKAKEEIYYLRDAGTIECMVRNKDVAEHVKHFEERAERAEAERDELRSALEAICSYDLAYVGDMHGTTEVHFPIEHAKAMKLFQAARAALKGTP